MSLPLRFLYSGDGPTAMPLVPITLRAKGKMIETESLLDTGSTVNVLPYEVGLALGFLWEEQTVPVELGGNLGASAARAVVVMAQIGEFSPKRLVFAWTQAEGFRPILGQMNFLMEFNACFFRSDGVFEIHPHGAE